MATPPTPPPLPPPGFFERRAALAAAKAKAASTATDAFSSSTLAIAPTLPTTINYADTISDVSPFIPITLDLPKHNYYHWRHLFEVHLGRCNLLDHVAPGSVARPFDHRWVKDDLAIIQWIYQCVSTEIFNLVFRDATNAAALWVALRQLFQDNVDARINTLHTELHNTVQGDS
nr:uncharacterized protein LOC109764249 [Aegilops tauschii subsp. strangulata]